MPGGNKDKGVGSLEGLLCVTGVAWAGGPATGDIQFERWPEVGTRKLIDSSFSDLDGDKTSYLIPYDNRFVDDIVRAFQQELTLIIRPDDVWLAILIQFNCFANGNANERKIYFPDQDDKVRPEKIKLSDLLFHEKVHDPELREWVMAEFTTTTEHDTIVAAIVMMGTLHKRTDYSWSSSDCGFPSVTLLGEKFYWEKIWKRVEKLPKYGAVAADWSKLLVPILNNIIATFNDNDSTQLKDFWCQACYSAGKYGNGDVRHSLASLRHFVSVSLHPSTLTLCHSPSLYYLRVAKYSKLQRKPTSEFHRG